MVANLLIYLVDFRRVIVTQSYCSAKKLASLVREVEWSPIFRHYRTLRWLTNGDQMTFVAQREFSPKGIVLGTCPILPVAALVVLFTPPKGTLPI